MVLAVAKKATNELDTKPVMELVTIQAVSEVVPEVIFEKDAPFRGREDVVYHMMSIQACSKRFNGLVLEMCVSFKLLRDSHKEMYKDSAGNDGGMGDWEKFCKANFANLSLSSIRASIRAGEMILLNGDEANAKLTEMSRAAIFMLADSAPEVRSEVLALAETKPNITAAEIRDLRDRCERSESKVESLEKRNASLDSINAKLASDRQAAEQEADALEATLADLKRKAQTPVEAIVYKLPPDVADAEEMLAKINKELNEKISETDGVSSTLAQQRAKLTDTLRNIEGVQAAADQLLALEKMITSISVGINAAIAQSISDSSPQAKHRLRAEAAKLHQLADVLNNASK